MTACTAGDAEAFVDMALATFDRQVRPLCTLGCQLLSWREDHMQNCCICYTSVCQWMVCCRSPKPHRIELNGIYHAPTRPRIIFQQAHSQQHGQTRLVWMQASFVLALAAALSILLPLAMADAFTNMGTWARALAYKPAQPLTAVHEAGHQHGQGQACPILPIL